MCLSVTQTVPHSKSPFRYKILHIYKDRGKTKFYSPYRNTQWTDKKLELPKDFPAYKPEEMSEVFTHGGGIHVFTTLNKAKHALKQMGHRHGEILCIVKIRVSGFLGAGYYGWRFSCWAMGWKGEVWRRARIVKVYENED